MASDEELEVQVGEGGPETKDGSEDGLECDQIDSCGDTGPHCREGLRERKERGVVTMRLWWIETQDAGFLLVFHHVR